MCYIGVATQGCWFIVNLTVIPQNRILLYNAGVCEVLVDILHKHTHVSSVAEQGNIIVHSVTCYIHIVTCDIYLINE